MFATQVLASSPDPDQVRTLIRSCRFTETSADYVSQIVRSVAAATESQFAIWLEWPVHATTVVAQTNGPVPPGLIALCSRTPMIASDWIVAAPVCFRSTIVGVLAAANGRRPYTSADVSLLSQVGRTAVLEYEIRRQAEALAMEPMASRVANMTHDLRQPLGILEACTCLLEIALPPGETRAREHLEEMHRQLDLAGAIVDEAVAGYTGCLEASRDFTNSAISMVT